MKEAFEITNFRPKALAFINDINRIIEEYMLQGFVLTLRQIYYQLVSRAMVENTMKSYKNVGRIVNEGRLSGLIDWNAIEDRTRNLRKVQTWRSPEQIIDAVAYSYKEDLWDSQPTYVEVWIEKDALVGVIESICDEYRVPYFSCRGNVSQSEAYIAGKRIRDKIPTQTDRRDAYILHLGDHDPNGIDMTRDLEKRVNMFAGGGNAVTVKRIALNIDQVHQYNPPPNPAKDTDSRFNGYVSKFGNDCWELDALEPRVIEGLIKKELDRIIDKTAWEAAKDEEELQRNLLGSVSQNWAKGPRDVFIN